MPLSDRVPTLIIDLGSIFGILSEWRAQGDLRDARDIARMFVEQPDRWISQIGRTGSDRYPSDLVSHRDFPDRRVLVRRGWDATEAARDLQPQMGLERSGVLDALGLFERAGFIVSESKSTGGLHLASEIIGMASAGGMPPVMLLATGDPSVEPILRTVRASGVRTGLVLFGTAMESRELARIADRFTDLPEVVISAFGLSLHKGFRVLDWARQDLRQLVAEELRQSASFISYEDLRRELLVVPASETKRSIVEIPRYANGLKALLEEWFAGSGDELYDEDDQLNDERGSWILAPDGLVRASLVEEIAGRVRKLVERSPRPLSAIGIEVRNTIMQLEPDYRHETAYLGHRKLVELLELMDQHMGSRPDWHGWEHRREAGTDYLVLSGTDILASTEPPPPSELGRVAQLVTDSLAESGGQVALADLAGRVAAAPDIRFSKANQWGGHKTFIDLLRAAEASSSEIGSHWEYVTVAPGSLRSVVPAGDGSVAEPQDAGISLLRRFVQKFPSQDISASRQMAAIVATILGPLPTLGILYTRPSDLLTEARDLANNARLRSNRGSFEFLLHSIRDVGRIDGYEPVNMRGLYSIAADLMLAHAGLPAVQAVAADEIDVTRPAAEVLLEIVAASNIEYIKNHPDFERNGGERAIEQVRARLVLGSSPTRSPTPEEIVGRVQRLRVMSPEEASEQVLAMLAALRDDRLRFYQSTASSGDPRAYLATAQKAMPSVQVFLAETHGSAARSGSLEEVALGYHAWASTQGQQGIGFAAFAAAVAELIREGVIALHDVDWSTAPGWLLSDEAGDSRLSGSRAAHRDWRAVHQMLLRVTNGYLSEGRPVSWVDVAAALVRGTQTAEPVEPSRPSASDS
jgi:hypothetical protein